MNDENITHNSFNNDCPDRIYHFNHSGIIRIDFRKNTMERNEVISLIKEHLTHKETGDKTVISGLFHAFKEDMLVVFTRVTGELEFIKTRLLELVDQRKITNEKIEKLEAKIAQLELTDATVIEKLNIIDKTEKKDWDVKTIIIGTMIGGVGTFLMKFLIK